MFSYQFRNWALIFKAKVSADENELARGVEILINTLLLKCLCEYSDGNSETDWETLDVGIIILIGLSLPSYFDDRTVLRPRLDYSPQLNLGRRRQIKRKRKNLRKMFKNPSTSLWISLLVYWSNLLHSPGQWQTIRSQ